MKRPASPLVVEVGDLLDRPNTRRPVTVRLALDEMAVAGSRLSDVDAEADADLSGGPVGVDLVLESMPSGVAVDGTVTFPWVGDCRRCLEEVRGETQAEVHEVYELAPTPEETLPVEQDQIDLEPVVREAVLLGLPLAPLCRDDCRGPAPDDFPARLPGDVDPDAPDADGPAGEGPRDPRWAALDDLRFDET